MKKNQYFACLLVVLSFVMVSGVLTEVRAEGKMKPYPIVLGQSCALTGPSKDLGLELRGGLLAAFSKVNEEGGVHGREIRLLSRDDGYEPDRAIRNTLALINTDHVLMLIGEVGTPTSKAVIPLVEKYEIPFFAPFSGADLLRSPFRRYVINVRGSYYQEIERVASYLVNVKGIKRIACFYQNDSYGYAGLKGLELALERRGVELVSTASYERNTVAVIGGLEEIHAARPEAVVLVGTYSACAEFIKLSKNKYSGELIYGSISFVGTESLKETLGGYGKNVIVSQVVPLPTDNKLPLVREYERAMGKYQHDVPLSFTSLEGYIAGKLFAMIAREVPQPLTREKFIETMHSVGRFDLGGVVLQFGPDDHQGSDEIYLTSIYPEIEVIHDPDK
ncbi:ABC transporter substrate-binding protein [Desulfosediminicola sp.]|uniref:ABC transporter substrate-binding protein n=1 Tax=Desulfosediminicola sp. TaxID=2886825 RepID=UPI003AF2F729